MSKPLEFVSVVLSGRTESIHEANGLFVEELNKYVAEHGLKKEDIYDITHFTEYTGRITHVKKD